MAETFFDSLLRWLRIANIPRRMPHYADNVQRPVIGIEQDDGSLRYVPIEDLSPLDQGNREINETNREPT